MENKQSKQRPSLASTRASVSLSNPINLNHSDFGDKATKVCRICLGEGLPKGDDKQKFIKPCKCCGSLEYMHESCLMEWVNTMVKKKIEMGQPTDNMTCEICKQTLELVKDKRFVLRNFVQIKNKIKIFWILFTITFGLFLVTLAGLGAIGYIQATQINQNSSETGRTAVLIAWIVLGLLLLFWVGRLFYFFCLDREVYVKSVAAKKEQERRPTSVEYPNSNTQSAKSIKKEEPLRRASLRNQSAQNLNNQIVGQLDHHPRLNRRSVI